MQNVTIDKTELDVIYDTLSEVTKYKEITEDELKLLSDDLYKKLFEYRDTHADSPLKKPACYSLVDIFKELKFGRPAESQRYLQKCIDELSENI
jgi:hypothetical protein